MQGRMKDDGAARPYEGQVAQSRLTRAVEWALSVPEESCRRRVDRRRAEASTVKARAIAERMVKACAWKAGMEGFVTSFGSNVLIALPAALGDLLTMLHFYARLTAEIGYLANANYFADPAWRIDAYATVFGPKVFSHLAREVGVPISKHLVTVGARRIMTDEMIMGLQRWVPRWLAKRITERGLVTKTVPIVGGLVGGLWNYVEMRRIGRRIIKYHFDDKAAAE
jgi:hypothetical protein